MVAPREYFFKLSDGKVVSTVAQNRYEARRKLREQYGYDEIYTQQPQYDTQLQAQAGSELQYFKEASASGINVNPQLQSGTSTTQLRQMTSQNIIAKQQFERQQYERQQQEQQALLNEQAQQKADAYFMYTKNYAVPRNIVQERLTGEQTASKRILPSDSRRVQETVQRLRQEGYNAAEIANILTTGVAQPQAIATSATGEIIYRDVTPKDRQRPIASYEAEAYNVQPQTQQPYLESKQSYKYRLPETIGTSTNVNVIAQKLNKNLDLFQDAINAKPEPTFFSEVVKETGLSLAEYGKSVGRGLLKTGEIVLEDIGQKPSSSGVRKVGVSAQRVKQYVEDPDVIASGITTSFVAAGYVYPPLVTGVSRVAAGYTGYQFATNPTPKTASDFVLSVGGTRIRPALKTAKNVVADVIDPKLTLVSRTKIKALPGVLLKTNPDVDLYVKEMSINPKQKILYDKEGTIAKIRIEQQSQTKPEIQYYEEVYKTRSGLELKRVVGTSKQSQTKDVLTKEFDLQKNIKKFNVLGQGRITTTKQFESVLLGDTGTYTKAFSVDKGKRFIDLQLEVPFADITQLKGVGKITTITKKGQETIIDTENFVPKVQLREGKNYITSQYTDSGLQMTLQEPRRIGSSPVGQDTFFELGTIIRGDVSRGKATTVLSTFEKQPTLSTIIKRKKGLYNIAFQDEKLGSKVSSVYTQSKQATKIKKGEEFVVEGSFSAEDELPFAAQKVNINIKLPDEEKSITFQSQTRKSVEVLPMDKTVSKPVQFFDTYERTDDFLTFPFVQKKSTDFDFIGKGRVSFKPEAYVDETSKKMKTLYPKNYKKSNVDDPFFENYPVYNTLEFGFLSSQKNNTFLPQLKLKKSYEKLINAYIDVETAKKTKILFNSKDAKAVDNIKINGSKSDMKDIVVFDKNAANTGAAKATVKIDSESTVRPIGKLIGSAYPESTTKPFLVTTFTQKPTKLINKRSYLGFSANASYASVIRRQQSYSLLNKTSNELKLKNIQRYDLKSKYDLKTNLLQKTKYDMNLGKKTKYDLNVQEKQKYEIVNKIVPSYDVSKKKKYEVSNKTLAVSAYKPVGSGKPLLQIPVPQVPNLPATPTIPERFRFKRPRFDEEDKKQKKKKLFEPRGKPAKLKRVITPTAYAIGFSLKGKTQTFSAFSGLGGRFIGQEPRPKRLQFERKVNVFKDTAKKYEARLTSKPKSLYIPKIKGNVGKRNNFTFTKVAKGTFYGRPKF